MTTHTVTPIPHLAMRKLADGIEVATLILLSDGTGTMHEKGSTRPATAAELEEVKRAFWGLTP